MIRYASRYVLYRAFGPDGQLLYIGVTQDFKRRKAAHMTRAAWRRLVAYWETEDAGCHYSAAISTERRAIVAEQPEFNCSLHKFTPGSFVGDGGPERGAPHRPADRRAAQLRGAA